MKYRIMSVLIVLLLTLLSGCSSTKEYYQTFKGNSTHWSAQFVQDAAVTYKDHPEFKDQYEIDYDEEEVWTLNYQGDEPDLGAKVEITFPRGSSTQRASEGEVIPADRIFTHSSGTGGTTSISKDMEFPAVDDQDTIFEVKVKWNGREELIEVKAGE
ncbi:hypothetical protein [Bacillus sp. KH172YL63]|uniref:hypothetical protein n=1 Tax=Bacillus sp. KH172YL63 TaxID=2709784 RepID=UPI0013E4977B|nr:hypothetical protein [Bacillus sp. KH172YL63]BCB04020.1 hypothetical protein KH172YL63_21530 [Bacillus sp. KH172YL63]